MSVFPSVAATPIVSVYVGICGVFDVFARCGCRLYLFVTTGIVTVRV